MCAKQLVLCRLISNTQAHRTKRLSFVPEFDFQPSGVTRQLLGLSDHKLEEVTDHKHYKHDIGVNVKSEFLLSQ